MYLPHEISIDEYPSSKFSIFFGFNISSAVLNPNWPFLLEPNVRTSPFAVK